ncbi:hypothetical protein EGH21_12635 [Halomicroarcula sp. F13]|uniref:Holin n=1 Tax=Haloarcula rubra TaxID=2487747 RepID=A0AAW4PU90_9EURY|nr:hypothetical protein [Halomicroarcula rubra]MBX0323877.1 hypothetical protein [Halomicroarcula rubra]
MERLKNLVLHPLTGGAVILSALGSLGLGLFDPLWGLLSATSGYWFPAVATTAATILPELGYAELGTKLLVAAAVLYVVILADKGLDRAQKWFNNR